MVLQPRRQQHWFLGTEHGNPGPVHHHLNQATAAGLAVKDFDAAMAELRGSGVEFQSVDLGEGMATVDGVLTTPTGTRIAWFRDSEGNIIGLSPDIRP